MLYLLSATRPDHTTAPLCLMFLHQSAWTILSESTLLLILSSVIRAVTQKKNKKKRETSSALFYFSLAAFHFLSTAYFTDCHLVPTPLLCPATLPRDVITSIQWWRWNCPLPPPPPPTPIWAWCILSSFSYWGNQSCIKYLKAVLE